MKETKEVATDENYLKAMVADSYKGWKDYRAEKIPYCRPFMEDTENYSNWSRYKEGRRLEDVEFFGVLIAPIVLELLLL
ncbi:MAG: hypothetical protein J1F13_00195 [Prevotellaceae bacterium]|nr:hypothetical protein [Prevotellaceae bacterium]